MPFKAIIFDLDGTILDTLEDIATCTNNVLKKNNFPIHPINSYKYFVGEGMGSLVKKTVPEHTEEKIIQQCISQLQEEYKKNWNTKTAPYPGIPELLDELEKQNFSKSILSNKPHENTIEAVATMLKKWRFDYIFGTRSGIPQKPHPAVALEIASNLGIPPKEVIFAGDTSIDMQTAKAAGMYAIGVSWGFREKIELRQNGADNIINHPLELMQIIKTG